MQSNSKLRRVGIAVAGLAACVALASCGGSSNSDNGTPPAAAATTPTLASASANIAGFIAYLKVLVITMPDTASPIDITGFVAPTDDTALYDPSI